MTNFEAFTSTSPLKRFLSFMLESEGSSIRDEE